MTDAMTQEQLEQWLQQHIGRAGCSGLCVPAEDLRTLFAGRRLVQAEGGVESCECGDQYAADSFGAGFLAATGKCPNCLAASPGKEVKGALHPNGEFIHELPE